MAPAAGPGPLGLLIQPALLWDAGTTVCSEKGVEQCAFVHLCVLACMSVCMCVCLPSLLSL